jgi:hypothetical protein
MPRKKRSLDRDAGVLRDAPLIVIASEDTYAVKQYFDRFLTTRVQFETLTTQDGRSSPVDIIARLDDHRRNNVTEDYDQFWACFDQDHWARANHIHNLSDVLAHCRKTGYRVAISNPCFELWLIMHLEDPDLSAVTTCQEARDRLARLAGGYNKTKCCGSMPFTSEHLHAAINRSKAIDTVGEIPASPLTRVYLIVEELLAKESIIFI